MQLSTSALLLSAALAVSIPNSVAQQSKPTQLPKGTAISLTKRTLGGSCHGTESSPKFNYSKSRFRRY